jgi:hypothetical protein
MKNICFVWSGCTVQEMIVHRNWKNWVENMLLVTWCFFLNVYIEDLLVIRSIDAFLYKLLEAVFFHNALYIYTWWIIQIPDTSTLRSRLFPYSLEMQRYTVIIGKVSALYLHTRKNPFGVEKYYTTLCLKTRCYDRRHKIEQVYGWACLGKSRKSSFYKESYVLRMRCLGN